MEAQRKMGGKESKVIRSFTEYLERYFPGRREQECKEELQKDPEVWGKFCAKRMFNPNLTAKEFLHELMKDPIYVFKRLFRKPKPKQRIIIIQPREGRQLLTR